MSKKARFKALLCLVAMGTTVYFALPFVQRRSAQEIKTRGYLVSSRNCHIPDINPFHQSVMPFLDPEPGPINCDKGRPPLTFTESHEGRVRLRFANNATGRHRAKKLKCCYSVIERFNDSTNNPLSACVDFKDGAILPLHVAHVLVKCNDVYASVHPVVQTQEGVGSETSRRLTSVVVIGVDSMSRLSLLRNMPRTVDLLGETGWLELKGYNKVGDNTLPNLMAILTGLNENQTRDLGCLPPATESTGFDHCPFLWHDFKRQGYTTAYAEDEVDFSTFNYETQGFVRQPTDFYLRPAMVEAHKRLRVRRVGNFAVCLGRTRTTDFVLRYTLDLLNAHPSGLFELAWLNNFSHDDGNLPGAADATLAAFFQELATMEAFRSTIFVFLSDHGIRFGSVRQTNVGWFEERLPFAYLRLPPDFRERNPTAFASLAGNAAKLTSPFDLHVTLKGVLGRRDAATKGCPKCASLFEPVDPDRSCADAGISPHWCTCLRDIHVSTTSPKAMAAADAVVVHVNALLSAANNKSIHDAEDTNMTALGEAKRTSMASTLAQQVPQCVLLSVGKITRAREVVGAMLVADRYVDFRVVVVAEPRGAVLEATVRHWKGGREVLGVVSRVTAMVQGEACPWVRDKVVRMYCYCDFPGVNVV